MRASTFALAILPALLAAGIPGRAADQPASPNLLRNSAFTQCANPGVPDWWGTGAPENIRDWKGRYGTVADAPLAGVRGLRLVSPGEGGGFSVQSHAHALPSGREYTYSLYLKGSEDGVRAILFLGEQTKALAVTREWQRYRLTATPQKGWGYPGRMVVRFGIQGPGTLLVAAPQLEYGGQATPYRPADADSQAPAKASAGPAIPPNPIPLPQARCPKVAALPAIDGKLDDACYAQAARLSGFRDMGTGDPARVETECFLLRDDRRLVVAFRCREPDMARLAAKVAQRDGSIFTDDTVEVFLQPDPKSPDYLHLGANPLGTRYDAKMFDAAWNADWEAVSTRGEGEWCIEIAVPFAGLGLTPRTQETWRANFCRTRVAGGGPQHSQWSCAYVGYHVPARFGSVFGFARRDLAAYFREPRRPPAPAAATGPPPLAATFELSFYTTEPTARLWIESRLRRPAGLRVFLRNRQSGATLDLTPAGSAAVPAKGASYVPFPIASLPGGDYEATVTAAGPGGQTLAQVRTPLVKLPPSPVEVKMHRVNRSLIVNGKPMLVYADGIHGREGGWWLEDIAAHGFNTVVAICGAYRTDAELDRDEPGIRAFLDECTRHGLKVVLWLGPPAGPYPPMREATVRTINRLKDHPAIICWYLLDEPEGWWAAQEGDKKEENLVDLYRAARAADPYRPCHINWYAWSKGKGGYGSLDATDIGSLDRYPVGRGANALQATGDIVRLMNDDCRPRRQPTAFWVQQYGYDDAVREPTVAEEAGMTYVSLIQGMRLIYYFIYKPMSDELWESMKPLGDELRALEPVLTDPDARELAVGVEKERVHYCLWQSRGRYYLLAANASDEPASVTLDLRRLAGKDLPHTASAWFGAPAPAYRRGRLSLALAANQRLVVELR